ncbi:MAG: DUF4173 domain-containing protein [Bacteroidia bacterium]|nr:DUF4173 domain-containing protein [Bacteroidia bacterium]
MKKNDVILVVSVALYSYLFYSQSAGINFVLFSVALISALLIKNLNLFKSKKWLGAAAGSLISATFAAIYGNSLSITANIISLALLSAFSIHGKTSVVFGLFYSIYSVLSSYVFMVLDSIERKQKSKTVKGNKTWLKIMLGVTVFLIFLIFFFLYRESNPLFYNLTKNINLDFITWGWVGFTTLGAFILYGFYYNKNIPVFYKSESDASESLAIKDIQSNIVRINLENKTGSILLILLNLLLITVNILDIIYLWGNSKLPAGMTYSDYVHQGTGTLILSILIAISIILFFFRSHLNYYEKNKIIKAMAYLWILQNIFMIVSTAYRNQL